MCHVLYMTTMLLIKALRSFISFQYFICLLLLPETNVGFCIFPSIWVSLGFIIFFIYLYSLSYVIRLISTKSCFNLPVVLPFNHDEMPIFLLVGIATPDISYNGSLKMLLYPFIFNFSDFSYVRDISSK